jgi:hypothetical protein
MYRCLPRTCRSHRLGLRFQRRIDGRRQGPPREDLVFLVGAYDVLAANSYVHFFPGPVIVEILIATCIGLAALTAKPRGAASTGTVHGSATAFHSQ